jgi:hypothetical protein
MAHDQRHCACEKKIALETPRNIADDGPMSRQRFHLVAEDADLAIGQRELAIGSEQLLAGAARISHRLTKVLRARGQIWKQGATVLDAAQVCALNLTRPES